MAVLLVIEPSTLVVGPVSVAVGASAFRLIVDPLAFVNVAVSMLQFPLAIGFVVSPLALVPGAIRPKLNAKPIPHAAEPLPCIHRAVFKSKRPFGDPSVLVCDF